MRGRQNELLALSELHFTVFENNTVLPVIEPIQVKSVSSFRKFAQPLRSIPFVLVVNPTVGPLANAKGRQAIEKEIINDALSQYQDYLIGIVISPTTQRSEIDHYLKSYPDTPKTIIHQTNYFQPDELIKRLSGDKTINYQVFFDSKTNEDYRRMFSGFKKVLIKDGFNKQDSNSAYPPRESFGNLHSNYRQMGYEGFGDFLIVGENYIEKGGTPHAVAIHLTYPTGADLRMAHFLSDDKVGTADVAGKFGQALKKLITFVNEQGLTSKTVGIREFEKLYKNDKNPGMGPYYPGLGAVKKISMKHHLELIKQLM